MENKKKLKTITLLERLEIELMRVKIFLAVGEKDDKIEMKVDGDKLIVKYMEK